MPPPIPVKLDGDLPHIMVNMGDTEDDNLITPVEALVDTGAGATIGNLRYFEGLILQNPSILVEVFTARGGKYSPITMHGIVDPNAEGGVHTTELPIAFRIKTVYKLRNGNELHLMVGLGAHVSVNFIISNAWLKQIGGVIDYGAHALRIPLHSDMKRFEVTYHHPKKSVPQISGGNIHAHTAAFKDLPMMSSFLRVMRALDKESPYLGYATNLVQQLQKSSLSSIPAHIGNIEPERVAVAGRESNPPPQPAPGPDDGWGRPRVSFANVVPGDTADGNGSVCTHYSEVTNKSASDDNSGHAFGQAALAPTHEEDSDEDLFSSSDECATEE